MRRAALLLIGLLLPAAAGAAGPDQPPLLRLRGGYLAYSYDHLHILGENVRMEWFGWTATARSVKIDLTARTAAAAGGVVLAKGGTRLEADEWLFDLPAESGITARYGDELKASAFPPSRPVQDAAAEARARRAALDGVSWAKMRGSLLYASGPALEIMPDLQVYGDDVLMHVEGLDSVGFKRLKLSGGEKPRATGLSLDRVWYTRNQGLFGDASLTFERDKILRSRTQLHYEEHTILADYPGLPRQLDLQTSTVWSANPGLDLGLEGNYSSTGLGNARLFGLVKSRDAKRSAVFDLAYRSPLQSAGETWLGVQTDLRSDGWGRLTFSGRQEWHDQTMADLSYAKEFGRRLRFDAVSRYTHLRIGGRGASSSRLWTGDIRLSYEADSYQAAAEYHLNDDLLGGRSLTRPQMRLALRPLTFYGGLLTATLSNVLVLSSMTDAGKTTHSYNDNTAFSLAAAPVRVASGLTVRTSVSAEQFVEKEGRNFTSGGLVLQVAQEFAPGVTLEAYYGAQSRRRSRGWLIEGTTSQDLTAAFRVRTGGRIDGWLSVSYDPKYGDWKQGFADVSVGLIKGWRVKSLLNYDFYGGRLANIELYLIRRAGRFDLRFVWRSLSKQFLVELVPAV